MKTFFALILVFLIVLGGLTTAAYAQAESETIRQFDTVITVQTSGKISVRDTIDYDFGASERHGIFRDIPFVKTNEDGKKYRMSLDNFSVTDTNGDPYTFEKIWYDEYVQLKIGDANVTISGEHTYIISYDVSGAMTYFSDNDELYWNITGNSWEVPIEKFSANIALPESIVSDQIEAICYTGAYGATDQNCSYSITGNTVQILSTGELSAYEGVSTAVKFPSGSVAVLEPVVVVGFFDTFLGKSVLAGVMILGLFWYLIYPIWIIFKWYNTGRDPQAGPGLTAYFDAPEDNNKRKVTPAETGGLYDETIESRDIVATYIDFAVRGYLAIQERKKNEFILVRNKGAMVNSMEMLEFERVLIETTFLGKDEVDLKKANLLSAFESTRALLYVQLVKNGYFDKNPNATRNFYTAIGGLAVGTFNIFLVVAAFIFGRHMPKKTLFGAREKNKAAGLRNFLKSQERHFAFEKNMDKQKLFESLLAYAVAFGVEKEWAEHFKSVEIVQPTWYSGAAGRAFTINTFGKSISGVVSSTVRVATPTRSSSGFSSGFSSGGGFSGGGGGGGGGGSW